MITREHKEKKNLTFFKMNWMINFFKTELSTVQMYFNVDPRDWPVVPSRRSVSRTARDFTLGFYPVAENCPLIARGSYYIDYFTRHIVFSNKPDSDADKDLAECWREVLELVGKELDSTT